jgi:hypothetical protein
MEKAIHPGSTLNSIVAVVIMESLKKLNLAHSSSRRIDALAGDPLVERPFACGLYVH